MASASTPTFYGVSGSNPASQNYSAPANCKAIIWMVSTWDGVSVSSITIGGVAASLGAFNLDGGSGESCGVYYRIANFSGTVAIDWAFDATPSDGPAVWVVAVTASGLLSVIDADADAGDPSTSVTSTSGVGDLCIAAGFQFGSAGSVGGAYVVGDAIAANNSFNGQNGRPYARAATGSTTNATSQLGVAQIIFREAPSGGTRRISIPRPGRLDKSIPPFWPASGYKLATANPQIVITGTLAADFGGFTMAASASEAMTGTLAATWPDWVMAAAGANEMTGTLAATWPDWVLAATATEEFTSSLAALWPDWLASMSGNMDLNARESRMILSPSRVRLPPFFPRSSFALATQLSNDVSGTLGGTWPGWTLAASGVVEITGALAATFPDWTLAASATEAFAGTLAAVWPDWIFAGVGAEAMTGSLAGVWPDWSLAATGTVINPVTGTLVATWPDWLAALTVTEELAGSLAGVWPDWTMAATATETFACTMSAAWPGWDFAGIGAEQIPSSASFLFPDWTMAATGTVNNANAGTLAAVWPDWVMYASESGLVGQFHRLRDRITHRWRVLDG